MPAPEDLLSLINGLQTDQDEVTARLSAKAAADVAASAAASAAAVASQDCDAARAHLAADLVAAHAKLDTLYGSPAS